MEPRKVDDTTRSTLQSALLGSEQKEIDFIDKLSAKRVLLFTLW